MTSTEFFEFLSRFAKRPIPSTEGRHVYIWQGAQQDLMSKAPQGLVTLLDLHALGHALDRTPSTVEAARRLLAETLDAWLARQFPQDDQQRVLIVTGCDLLMRYQVPSGLFVRLASESKAVVLAIPANDSRFKPSKPLPAYVLLRPDATLSYFKTQIGENAIIGE